MLAYAAIAHSAALHPACLMDTALRAIANMTSSVVKSGVQAYTLVVFSLQVEYCILTTSPVFLRYLKR